MTHYITRAFAVLVLALAVSQAGFASDAGKTATIVAGETIFDADAGKAIVDVQEYSRLGSDVTVRYTPTIADIPICNKPGVTCKNLVAREVQIDMACSGGDDNVNYGGWNVNIIQGQCWSSLDVCNTATGACTPVLPSDLKEISVTPGCENPQKAWTCVHDAGGGKIKLDTGDDMFSLPDGAGSYMQNTKLADPQRLKWIERNGGESQYDLMIPSGPLTGIPTDYIGFLSNAPGFVNVEDACYPINVSLCQVDQDIPMDAVCGWAVSDVNPSWDNVSAIPVAALCDPATSNFGVDTSNAAKISWTCTPKTVGAQEKSCEIARVNAQCGSANGDNFANIQALQAAQLCVSPATPVSSPAFAQGGGWNWTCGNTSGADSDPCHAGPVSQGLEIADLVIKEDQSGTVTIAAGMADVTPVDVMSITIGNIPANWGFSGAGWVPTVPAGGYVKTLPAGVGVFSGTVTLTPPANSDADLDNIPVTAKVTHPGGGGSFSASTTFDVIVDAVADQPAAQSFDLTQVDLRKFFIPIDIFALSDTDGSEEIVRYEIIFDNGTFWENRGYRIYDSHVENNAWVMNPLEEYEHPSSYEVKAYHPGTANFASYKFVFDAKEFSGTHIYLHALYFTYGWNGFETGLTLRAVTEEVNLSGQEVDTTDNTAFVDVYDDFSTSSPLVLDLDGDGIELVGIDKGVKFDMENDGTPVKTGWIDVDDALLALDVNKDKLITSRAELFGQNEVHGHGFLKAAVYDSNKDGLLSAEDDVWPHLILWKDANTNGVSEPEEMFPMAHFGVASIKLEAEEDGRWIVGNFISHKSTFQYEDGREGEIVDAWFATDEGMVSYNAPKKE